MLANTHVTGFAARHDRLSIEPSYTPISQFRRTRVTGCGCAS